MYIDMNIHCVLYIGWHQCTLGIYIWVHLYTLCNIFPYIHCVYTLQCTYIHCGVFPTLGFCRYPPLLTLFLTKPIFFVIPFPPPDLHLPYLHTHCDWHGTSCPQDKLLTTIPGWHLWRECGGGRCWSYHRTSQRVRSAGHLCPNGITDTSSRTEWIACRAWITSAVIVY